MEYSTYIFLCHGSNGRLHINDGHEKGPHDSPGIDPYAGPAQMERPSLELTVCQFADDGDHITPIQSNGRQVEDGSDGGVGSQSDQIDQDAADGEQPYTPQGSIRPLVGLVPDPRERQHLVTGVRPDGPRSGLNGCHGSEVEHNVRTHGEEDPALPTDHLIEDLSHRLLHHVVECVGHISNGIGKHNGIQPAADPGEA